MDYPPYPLSNRARSIIFAVFTVLFLVIAPTVTLYTAGYRFQLDSFSFTRIGVLSIDIEPKDAKVYLNDKEIHQTLPMRVSDLTAGTYRLRIEKEGYLPWVKDIVIEKSKTTYIKDFRLFAINTPEALEISENLTDIFGSRDGNYILEQFDSGVQAKLVLFNTDQEQATPLIFAPPIPHNFVWSIKNNFLAFVSQNDVSIDVTTLAADTPTVSNTLHIDGAFHGYQWKENFYSENLFLHVDDLFYKINPKDDAQGAEKIHTTSSLVFRDGSNDDWYFDPETKNLVNLSNKNNNLLLKTDSIKKIVDINKNRAIVENSTGLFVVNRDNPEEVKELPTPNYFYDAEKKEYIAWSPWELWTIYENGTVALLNRMSEEILQVGALDQTGELLIVTKDKLLGFNPGYYVTHEILTEVEVKKTTVNKKNKIIYFFGTWKGKQGLYKLKY